jgi:hypothetical protein
MYAKVNGNMPRHKGIRQQYLSKGGRGILLAGRVDIYHSHKVPSVETAFPDHPPVPTLFGKDCPRQRRGVAIRYLSDRASPLATPLPEKKRKTGPGMII